MATPKRFIAGAICPRCAEMDKITMYTDDTGEQIRECIACGFTDGISDTPAPAAAAPELETRVNKRKNEDDHTVKQVVFFKGSGE